MKGKFNNINYFFYEKNGDPDNPIFANEELTKFSLDEKDGFYNIEKSNNLLRNLIKK